MFRPPLVAISMKTQTAHYMSVNDTLPVSLQYFGFLVMVAIDDRKCRNAKTKFCAVPRNKISVYKEIIVLYFQRPPLTSSLRQGVIFRALFSDTIMLFLSRENCPHFTHVQKTDKLAL
jgi:hypothetical protein